MIFQCYLRQNNTWLSHSYWRKSNVPLKQVTLVKFPCFSKLSICLMVFSPSHIISHNYVLPIVLLLSQFNIMAPYRGTEKIICQYSSCGTQVGSRTSTKIHTSKKFTQQCTTELYGRGCNLIQWQRLVSGRSRWQQGRLQRDALCSYNSVGSSSDTYIYIYIYI